MNEQKGKFETWTEELTVAGGDLYEKLQELMKDASVHRLRVINNRSGDVVFDIPVALGIGVALIANIWAVIGTAILYVADFQIVVERRVPVAEDDAAAESASDEAAEPEADASAEVVDTVDDVMGDDVEADTSEPEAVADETVEAAEEVAALAEPVEDDSASDAPVEEAAVAVEQCQGTTKAGSQCKRKPSEGSAYCYTHQPA